MAGQQFSIRKNRLEKALYKGMQLLEDESIVCSKEEEAHFFFLPMIDSGAADWQWGRLRFGLELPLDGVCYLYAMAANDKEAEEILQDPQIEILDKKRYLSSRNSIRFINQSDVLLYEIEGRYLWIAMEIIGDDAAISDIAVWSREDSFDSFMKAFPEVYQEKNSFFHRFLSIFSSLYNDFEERISHMDELLDIDKAPQGLLEIYLKWLGIDADGGFLDREMLKVFLREAGTLIPYKGTKGSLERICEIFVGEKPVVLERGLMQQYIRGSDKGIYDLLYGSSPYDVTLLLEQMLDAHRKEQLLHLLRQFKPARCRLRLVFLAKSGVLDSYTYLDKNAVTFTQEEGRLDSTALHDGAIVLS